MECKTLVSALLTGLCVAGCSEMPTAGAVLPTRATVVEANTGAPIEGATVVLKISAFFGFSGTRCAHIDAAVSDKSGEVSIPGWFDPRATDRSIRYLVYKPGYQWVDIDDRRGATLSMSPATDRLARLRQLNGLVSAISCLGDVKPSIVHLYELIVEEERALVRTDEERRKFLEVAEGALRDERTRLASMVGGK